MICNPGDAGEVRDRCGAGVDPLEIPIDDSWIRDNGPAFVTDGSGRLAAVHFGFNGWGERYSPYDKDARAPEAIAAHLGVPRYVAPLVLEGGSFSVDGEGTLLTTEQCLLNPNRNPELSREDIEAALRAYLGVETVVWLPHGMAKTSTDGHVDGIAQFVRPGVVALLRPSDEGDPNRPLADENLAALTRARDARGRSFEVLEMTEIAYPPPAGEEHGIAYLNTYLANGAVIAPLAGVAGPDANALELLRGCFPDREVVGVNARVLSYGGGGPHCVTQQVPAT